MTWDDSIKSGGAERRPNGGSRSFSVDDYHDESPKKKGRGVAAKSKIPLFLRNGPMRDLRNGEIERSWGKQVNSARQSFTAPNHFGKDKIKMYAPRIKPAASNTKVFNDATVPPMLHALSPSGPSVWGPPIRIAAPVEDFPKDLLGVNLAQLHRLNTVAEQLQRAQASPARPRMDGPPAMRSGLVPASKEAAWADTLCESRGYDATGIEVEPRVHGGVPFTPRETPRRRLERFAAKVEKIHQRGAPLRLSLRDLDVQNVHPWGLSFKAPSSARGVQGERRMALRERKWQAVDIKPSDLTEGIHKFAVRREMYEGVQFERALGKTTWTTKSDFTISDRANDPFTGMVF